MNIALLQRLARSPFPTLLDDPPNIAFVLDLRRRQLVTASCAPQFPATPTTVVVTGVTPEGHALLAIEQVRTRQAPPAVATA